MKHSSPILALLVALAAGGACAQTTGTVQGQAPVVSYGPVLDPQESPAPASPDARPQAQEEKAGAPPQSRQNEVDPSARPAPQPAQPEQPGAKEPPKKGKAKPRRTIQQRLQSTPRIAAPSAHPYGRVAAPAAGAPAPVAPAPAQITSCSGGICADTSGATYHTGVGNAAVSSSGRLCNRSGATMQCF